MTARKQENAPVASSKNEPARRNAVQTTSRNQSNADAEIIDVHYINRDDLPAGQQSAWDILWGLLTDVEGEVDHAG